MDDIEYYEITGSFVRDVKSKTANNFISLSSGVIPSSEYVLVVRVIYRTGQASGPKSVKVTTPRQRRCYTFSGIFTSVIF